MTLEDETDITNAIVWPKIYEKFRPVVLGARLIAITGKVQSEKGVIHVIAERIDDLTPMLSALSADADDLQTLSRSDEVAHPTATTAARAATAATRATSASSRRKPKPPTTSCRKAAISTNRRCRPREGGDPVDTSPNCGRAGRRPHSHSSPFRGGGPRQAWRGGEPPAHRPAVVSPVTGRTRKLAHATIAANLPPT
ncbi:MAG: hypothetical protein WDM94_01510 [Bauldia sp.]